VSVSFWELEYDNLSLTVTNFLTTDIKDKILKIIESVYRQYFKRLKSRNIFSDYKDLLFSPDCLIQRIKNNYYRTKDGLLYELKCLC
jgi:hypothetical protein